MAQSVIFTTQPKRKKSMNEKIIKLAQDALNLQNKLQMEAALQEIVALCKVKEEAPRVTYGDFGGVAPKGKSK